MGARQLGLDAVDPTFNERARSVLDGLEISALLHRKQEEFEQMYEAITGGWPTAPVSPDGEDVRELLRPTRYAKEVVRFRQGDVIKLAKDSMGPMAAYRAAAEALGKSTRWTAILCKVSEAFPPSLRFADVPWEEYRHASTKKRPIDHLLAQVAELLKETDR